MDRKPPPRWAQDELTKSFDTARSNQWATFVNKPMSRRLIEIDAQLVRISKDWLNPASEIAALLLLRSHAAFRTACGLAMAGQAAESHVQCRALMEYAAYAVHIHRNPTLAKVWLDRHEDAASGKVQKNAFTHRSVLDSVNAANIDTGRRFKDLYDRTIDLGAHPNERSVTANLEVLEEPDKRTMLTIMQHGDGVALDLALKTVAQCGVVALELLQIVFSARFELLGVNATMPKLRHGL